MEYILPCIYTLRLSETAVRFHSAEYQTLRTARFHRWFTICSALNDLFRISMRIDYTVKVASFSENPRNSRCNYQQLLFTHISPHNLHTAGSSFNCIGRVYILS